jgi:hypothetical protein
VPMPLEKFHVLWHADGGRRLLVNWEDDMPETWASVW